MRQKIGDIRNSKDIVATQTGAADAEQEIGSISESERLQLRQIAANDDTLAEALTLGLDITVALRRLSDDDRIVLRREVAPLIERAVGAQVDARTVENALQTIQSQEGVPGALRDVFRDLSVTISAVSGAVALSQLTDPVSVAVGIPAVLAMTGALASSKLNEIYTWVAQRLKSMLK
jgi:hypothetical protein